MPVLVAWSANPEMWVFTVPRADAQLATISVLDDPRAISPGTSRSRSVITSEPRVGPAVIAPRPVKKVVTTRGGSVLLSLPEAVHVRIHPAGTAERVLASWAGGELTDHWTTADDPSQPPPDRRRGAAVVLSRDRMLVIRYPPSAGRKYFIPGGGVELGETPDQAAVRELREETGLVGAVVRQLATVYNGGREEHYFLVGADSPHRARPLDLASGESLEWIDVADLPDTAMWPKRLSWRIAHWYTHGWPEPIAVFADSGRHLHAPCTW